MSRVVVVVPHTVRLTNVRCHAHPVLIALYEAGDIRVGKPHLCRPVAKFASLPNGEGATGATAGFAVTSVVWAAPAPQTGVCSISPYTISLRVFVGCERANPNHPSATAAAAIATAAADEKGVLGVGYASGHALLLRVCHNSPSLA